ncbi:MAG TPA: hypothetical protein IAA05_08500 [Candidatus Blautia excrementipullorum]|nr:hypothetical protein [Candidatus Blautia excrementipullorum]
MSLTFRVLTVCYTHLMMGLALFILTSGILGKKVKAGYLAVFCVCAVALQ